MDETNEEFEAELEELAAEAAMEELEGDAEAVDEADAADNEETSADEEAHEDAQDEQAADITATLAAIIEGLDALAAKVDEIQASMPAMLGAASYVGVPDGGDGDPVTVEAGNAVESLGLEGVLEVEDMDLL